MIARWLVLLLVVPLAHADDGAAPVLARWARGLEGLKTLRVEFEQTKTLKVLRRPRRSSGVALLVGKRVKLVTRRRGRVETELAVGETDVRIHYPRLKRLEVYPRAGGGAAMPFPMFGGDVEALPADYALSWKDGVLTMVPKREAAYAKAELRFAALGEGDDAALRVSRVVQVAANGDRVDVTVTRWVANPELAAGAVTLTVPEGTKVVRLAGR